MKKISLIASLVLLTASFCHADTLTVDDDGPADYDKIQDAINDAVDGDIVQVLQGHYFENIDFRGKAITVTSTDPNNPTVVENTIIDANSDGIVVSFHMGEDLDSVLFGITITGGYAQYGAGITCWNGVSPSILQCTIRYNIASDDGGGIFCNDGSNPYINKCVIEGNSASSNGGGIYFYNCNPTINSCSVSYNTVSAHGGGIYSYRSNPIISNCKIYSNFTASGCGGGIYTYSGNPLIKLCHIVGNSAGEGGGIYCHRNDCSILKCLVISNTANLGGGIYCLERSQIICNCIINCNSANEGGGIYHSHSGTPNIIYCTLNSNQAANGGGICVVDKSSPIIINNNNIIINSVSGCGIYALYSDPLISFNNVWGNAENNYDGWAWPGEGDISVDPNYVDPGYWDDNGTPGDHTDDFWVEGYHLHHNSPCINAGDPAYIPEPDETDIDGEPRIRLGSVDMGADEAGSNPADFDESGVVDIVDYGIMSMAWQTGPGETRWNELCNIFHSEQVVIDALDLAAYCDEWLWEASWHGP